MRFCQNFEKGKNPVYLNIDPKKNPAGLEDE